MIDVINYDQLISTEKVMVMSEQIEWVTTHEAAEIMDVKLSTVSALCRSGVVVGRQHGSGHRSVWEVDKQSALAYKKSVGGRPRKKKL
jgi:phage terminase Nu1 subunit (DNA packaging protein)